MRPTSAELPSKRVRIFCRGISKATQFWLNLELYILLYRRIVRVLTAHKDIRKSIGFLPHEFKKGQMRGNSRPLALKPVCGPISGLINSNSRRRCAIFCVLLGWLLLLFEGCYI